MLGGSPSFPVKIKPFLSLSETKTLKEPRICRLPAPRVTCTRTNASKPQKRSCWVNQLIICRITSWLTDLTRLHFLMLWLVVRLQFPLSPAPSPPPSLPPPHTHTQGGRKSTWVYNKLSLNNRPGDPAQQSAPLMWQTTFWYLFWFLAASLSCWMKLSLFG